MELLTPEVFAACREYLPFEEVDELQGLYAALQEGSSVKEQQRQLRRLSREYLEGGGLVGSRQATAAILLQNAEALEKIADESCRQAATEARELRVELRRAREEARERRRSADATRSKFERAAWPALEAGGRIALAESKLRTIELADALTSDWEAFAALKDGEEIEAPTEAEALAASAERAGLLLEIAGGAARGEETERTTAAIERHAQKLEGRLVEQLLFAAALRREDEVESGFRSRNEAGMVAAAEALDKLHQHLKPFFHDSWRDAVVARVATVWRRSRKTPRNGPSSSDFDRNDEDGADEPLAKFRLAVNAARKVVCGKDGELCAALRVFLKTEKGRERRLADFRDTTRKLVGGLVEELGLKQAVLEVLAAADYADADYFDDDNDGPALPPTNYLDALARLAAKVNGLHRALDRAVDCALGIADKKSKTRRRAHQDTTSLFSSEEDEDEIVDDQPTAMVDVGDSRRALSEAAKGEIASATETLLEAARRDYARREYDCLEAALAASGRELASAATAGTTATTTTTAESGSGGGFLFGKRKQQSRLFVADAADGEQGESAVPADASLSALLRGPLRSENLDSVEKALARSMARCSAVLPPVAVCDEEDDDGCGAHALTRAAVAAVLEKSGDVVEYRSSRRKSSLLGAHSTADDVSRELVRRARRFAYDRLLRPATRVAKERLEEIESQRQSVVDNKGFLLFGQASSGNGSKHWLEEDEERGPPRAFFDVVVAALDAEARWRRLEDSLLTGDVELREGASASLRVDVGDALRLAVEVFSGLVRVKLLSSSGSREDQSMYAAKSEPEKLQPTKAVSEVCRSLRVHVQTVAAIMRVQPARAGDAELDRAREIAAMLAARWRLALAHDIFSCFEDRVRKLKITPAGAFVLSRDVDELRQAVSSLGCVTTDNAFLELREHCALLKLDRDDLRHLLLADPNDTFAQDKEKLAQVIDMRADAWNARATKRLPWVDTLLQELHLQPDVRYVTGLT